MHAIRQEPQPVARGPFVALVQLCLSAHRAHDARTHQHAVLAEEEVGFAKPLGESKQGVPVLEADLLGPRDHGLQRRLGAI